MLLMFLIFTDDNDGVNDEDVGNNQLTGHLPPQVKKQRRAKANDRERSRMQTLNNALGGEVTTVRIVLLVIIIIIIMITIDLRSCQNIESALYRKTAGRPPSLS